MQKPTVYAQIPEFDQETQAVFQTEPVDMGDHIFMGIEVGDVPQDNGSMKDIVC